MLLCRASSRCFFSKDRNHLFILPDNSRGVGIMLLVVPRAFDKLDMFP